MGRRARTHNEKMKFFQRLPYKGPVFTKTVITLSFGVRFGPTITQNAREERGNVENPSGLRRRPGAPPNSAPKLHFLPLKVKEHHLPLLFRHVSEPVGTPSKEIREIMVSINISPPCKDKHCILHMLYDLGNPLWL